MQPIKCHGGKKYLASKIIDLMPPHRRFLEAFAGGASVLMRKDPHDPRHVFGESGEGCAEWLNDLNGDVSNFWRVLGDKPLADEFIRIASLTPLSDPVFQFNASLKFRSPIDDPLEQAIHFFILNRQSRQGLGQHYCTPTRRTRRGMNEHVSAWLSAVEELPAVVERLRTVEVWSRDAVEAIEALDGPDFLVYCDPPYMQETRGAGGEYGRFEMNDMDHIRLLSCLGSMQGKFILSGYANDLYESASKSHEWHRTTFDLPNNASSAKMKERKIECVWTNYEPKATRDKSNQESAAG